MTTAHNPFAGETPFPPAGDGVVFKFTNGDILKLYSLYGPDPRDPVEIEPGTNRLKHHFWSTVLTRAEHHDPHVLMNLCRIGLKERSGEKLVPIQRSPEWWDDPPFCFADTSDAIVSGLTWSRWMMTPDMLAQQMREQAERFARESQEAGAAAEDPQPRTAESPTSSI